MQYLRFDYFIVSFYKAIALWVVSCCFTIIHS